MNHVSTPDVQLPFVPYKTLQTTEIPLIRRTYTAPPKTDKLKVVWKESGQFDIVRGACATPDVEACSVPSVETKKEEEEEEDNDFEDDTLASSQFNRPVLRQLNCNGRQRSRAKISRANNSLQALIPYQTPQASKKAATPDVEVNNMPLFEIIQVLKEKEKKIIPPKKEEEEDDFEDEFEDDLSRDSDSDYKDDELVSSSDSEDGHPPRRQHQSSSRSKDDGTHTPGPTNAESDINEATSGTGGSSRSV